MKKFSVILLSLVATACCFKLLYVFFASGADVPHLILSTVVLGGAGMLCGAAIGQITSPDFGAKHVRPTWRLRTP